MIELKYQVSVDSGNQSEIKVFTKKYDGEVVKINREEIFQDFKYFIDEYIGSEEE